MRHGRMVPFCEIYGLSGNGTSQESLVFTQYFGHVLLKCRNWLRLIQIPTVKL